ncbi:ABC transporter substrate-binding protein [Sphingomonas montana]|uniref:ABC transporter substrate-binding protein n=1 Tax=Sphingomonas montana TaxID=1843236 RepID=UPI00096D462E|nr:ABC transporter substrate-binding protein [Sphingomonas montana]
MARRHLPLAALAALLPLSATAASPRPLRIVSLNLCADQYLVALADRGQIAALTRFARDPAMSTVAAQAATLPISRGTAEELLALRPDMVVTSPWRRSEVAALLKGRGVRIVDVPDASDYPGIRATIAQVAALVGHPARGRALTARMDAELRALGPPPGRGRTAAYWQRGGFLTGGGTLVDDMLRRAGLVNLATRLGRPALSRLSVERLVATPPDFLFAEDGPVRDRGTELLVHPAVARAVPPARRLHVPGALVTCATPSYPRAIAAIATQVRAATPAIPSARATP